VTVTSPQDRHAPASTTSRGLSGNPAAARPLQTLSVLRAPCLVRAVRLSYDARLAVITFVRDGDQNAGRPAESPAPWWLWSGLLHPAARRLLGGPGMLAVLHGRVGRCLDGPGRVVGHAAVLACLLRGRGGVVLLLRGAGRLVGGLPGLLCDAIKDAIDHRIGQAALYCHDGCARCEPDCDMDEAQRAELRITEGLAALALRETYLAARQRAGRRLGRRPAVRARARRAGGRRGDAGAG
jgi:hypothetical protein